MITAKLVRICVRTMGEIAARPAKRLPLKIAFPKTAAAPQHSEAAAIKK
jgi:hypothetical protein